MGSDVEFDNRVMSSESLISYVPMFSAGHSGQPDLPAACDSTAAGGREHNPASTSQGPALRVWPECTGHVKDTLLTSERESSCTSQKWSYPQLGSI